MPPSCLRVVVDDRIVWSRGEAGAAEASSKGVEVDAMTKTTTLTKPMISSTLTASAFLKSRPAGAYTTARTSSRGTRVFDLAHHIERLANSAVLLGGGGSGSGEKAPPSLPPPPKALGDASLLRPRVLALLRLGLLDSAGESPDPALGHEGEFRVTILATWNGENEKGKDFFSLSLHVAPLPPPPRQPVSALILGSSSSNSSSSSSSHGGRSRAAAKSTSWVSERAALEARGKGAGAEEVLLVEEEESEEEEEKEKGGGKKKRKRLLILEGLSSNFAAVLPRGGAKSEKEEEDKTRYGEGFELQTAGGDRVLSGTVRGLLLDVASRAGLLVRNSVCPAVEEASSQAWVGCLLLSTSRLALPVAELLREEEKATEVKEAETKEAEEEKDNGRVEKTLVVVASFRKEKEFHPVIRRLSEEVAAAVEGAASESILLEAS